jgi:hypothetical protein
MRSLFSKWAIFFFVLSVVAGCAGNDDKTQDPVTGKLTAKNCVNPFSRTDSFKGEIDLAGAAGYVTIPANVSDGSKRIIHLYNETTCSSRLDTDYIGDTDTYLIKNSDSPRTGLSVQSGDNRIDFIVEECQDIDIGNNYKCLNQIASDSGYVIVHVK